MQRPAAIVQRDAANGGFARLGAAEIFIAKMLRQLAREQRMIVLRDEQKIGSVRSADHDADCHLSVAICHLWIARGDGGL